MANVTSNTFKGCTFSGNPDDGVFMANAGYDTFTGCTFSGSLNDGVSMSDCLLQHLHRLYDLRERVAYGSGNAGYGIFISIGEKT